jgi:hypothetical protein
MTNPSTLGATLFDRMDTIPRSEAWPTDGKSDEVHFDAGLGNVR